MTKCNFGEFLLTFLIYSLGNASVYAQVISPSQIKPDTQWKETCERVAESVVKITHTKGGGTGVVIAKLDDEYVAITNLHVLHKDVNSYQISLPFVCQTNDPCTAEASLLGSKYPMQGNKSPLTDKVVDNWDLALIHFRSPVDIPVLQFEQNWEPSQSVMAVGYTKDSPEISILYQQGLLCLNPVLVSYILPRPMLGGYQIGFKGSVEWGMSGGPLVSVKGNIVGINGRTVPLFGIPIHLYRFSSDKTFVHTHLAQLYDLPEEIVLEKINRSSWAIHQSMVADYIRSQLPTFQNLLSPKMYTPTYINLN